MRYTAIVRLRVARELRRPDWEVPGRVTSYLAIRDASLERVTDAMRELTGRHPSSLDEYLRARPESLEHVTGEGA